MQGGTICHPAYHVKPYAKPDTDSKRKPIPFYGTHTHPFAVNITYSHSHDGTFIHAADGYTHYPSGNTVPIPDPTRY